MKQLVLETKSSRSSKSPKPEKRPLLITSSFKSSNCKCNCYCGSSSYFIEYDRPTIKFHKFNKFDKLNSNDILLVHNNEEDMSTSQSTQRDLININKCINKQSQKNRTNRPLICSENSNFNNYLDHRSTFRIKRMIDERAIKDAYSTINFCAKFNYFLKFLLDFLVLFATKFDRLTNLFPKRPRSSFKLWIHVFFILSCLFKCDAIKNQYNKAVGAVPGDLVLGALFPVHHAPGPAQAQTRYVLKFFKTKLFFDINLFWKKNLI